MDQTPVARKRCGRPPKQATTEVLSEIESSPQSIVPTNDDSNSVQSTEIEGSALAVSPTLDDVASTSAAAGGSSECRRSSRKKIIKFDVRDLLNKNRKPHKIQIEARIDSNAPTPPKGNANTALGQGAAASGSSAADLASKQKTFIEKSAIFRRFSISEQQNKNVNPLRPPQLPTSQKMLLLGKAGGDMDIAVSPMDTVKIAQARRLSRTQEIFNASMMKSKQNYSLIVAQMESSSSSSCSSTPISTPPTQRKVLPVGKRKSAANEPIEIRPPTIEPVVTLKRRGRPPKCKAPELFVLKDADAGFKIAASRTEIPSDLAGKVSKVTDLPRKLTPEKAKNWQEYKACLKKSPAPTATAKMVTQPINTSKSKTDSGTKSTTDASKTRNEPKKLPPAIDVILEISSSSDSSCTSELRSSQTSSKSVHSQESKQRNFASVSFLQESQNLDDENVTGPEFIVAAVEEIITEAQSTECNENTLAEDRLAEPVPEVIEIVEKEGKETVVVKPSEKIEETLVVESSSKVMDATAEASESSEKIEEPLAVESSLKVMDAAAEVLASRRTLSSSESETNSERSNKPYKKGDKLRVSLKRVSLPSSPAASVCSSITSLSSPRSSTEVSTTSLSGAPILEKTVEQKMSLSKRSKRLQKKINEMMTQENDGTKATDSIEAVKESSQEVQESTEQPTVCEENDKEEKKIDMTAPEQVEEIKSKEEIHIEAIKATITQNLEARKCESDVISKNIEDEEVKLDSALMEPKEESNESTTYAHLPVDSLVKEVRKSPRITDETIDSLAKETIVNARRKSSKITYAHLPSDSLDDEPYVSAPSRKSPRSTDDNLPTDSLVEEPSISAPSRKSPRNIDANVSTDSLVEEPCVSASSRKSPRITDANLPSDSLVEEPSVSAPCRRSPRSTDANLPTDFLVEEPCVAAPSRKSPRITDANSPTDSLVEEPSVSAPSRKSPRSTGANLPTDFLVEEPSVKSSFRKSLKIKDTNSPIDSLIEEPSVKSSSRKSPKILDGSEIIQAHVEIEKKMEKSAIESIVEVKEEELPILQETEAVHSTPKESVATKSTNEKKDEIKDEIPPPAPKRNITLPPKKQVNKFKLFEALSNVKETPKEIGEDKPVPETESADDVLTETNIIQSVSVETSTLLDILRTVQSNIVAATPVVTAALNEESSSSDTSKSPVPTSGKGKSSELRSKGGSPTRSETSSPHTLKVRRYEKRSRRAEESTNKTLEETFAEIAAQSSKEILEQAAKKSSHDEEDTAATLVALADSDVQHDTTATSADHDASVDQIVCEQSPKEIDIIEVSADIAMESVFKETGTKITVAPTPLVLETADDVGQLQPEPDQPTAIEHFETCLTMPSATEEIRPIEKSTPSTEKSFTEEIVKTKATPPAVRSTEAAAVVVAAPNRRGRKPKIKPVEMQSSPITVIEAKAQLPTDALVETQAIEKSETPKETEKPTKVKKTKTQKEEIAKASVAGDGPVPSKIAKDTNLCTISTSAEASKSIVNISIVEKEIPKPKVPPKKRLFKMQADAIPESFECRLTTAEIVNIGVAEIEPTTAKPIPLLASDSESPITSSNKKNKKTIKSSIVEEKEEIPKAIEEKKPSEEEGKRSASSTPTQKTKKTTKSIVEEREEIPKPPEEEGKRSATSTPTQKRGKHKQNKMEDSQAEPATTSSKKKQRKLVAEQKAKVEKSKIKADKKEKLSAKKSEKKKFLEIEDSSVAELSKKSEDKSAKKKRQKKLKEAFEAALLCDDLEKSKMNMENKDSAQDPMPRGPKTPEPQSPIYTLPMTPTEFDEKPKEPAVATITETTVPPLTVLEEEPPDPLKDIEKFIEDGVNLLKRGYKIDDDSVDEVISTTSVASIVATEIMSLNEPTTIEDVSTLESETAAKSPAPFTCYDTPADTPLVTPTATPPPKSPVSEATPDEISGVRRSHRIKLITKHPKALVGRGLVRDKERFSVKDDVETKSHYTLDDHLMDLAEVEAKNAKFLKDMEERLSNFQVIKENEYKCERVISREARKMICDCFLTSEEEERGELGCGEDCLNRLLMIECGPDCNVKVRCTNNRFQKFLCSPCRVFRTEKKGFGIMADIEILAGEFIMEYVGEVINGDEFEQRRTMYSKDKNRHYYFMALRSDAIIDATIKGNISRFINHSCDPNAETQKWTVNGELRIGFFSRKSIMPGEEITFDYQYQRYGREAQRCYCESSNCRGWIGEEPNSDEGEQLDEDSDEEILAEGLLDDDDDDDSDDSVADAEEVQKKLEIAAAEAKLTPISDDHKIKADLVKDKKKKITAGEEDKKENEEDSKSKFKKLLNKMAEKVAKKKKQKQKEKKQHKNRPHSPSEVASAKQRYLEDPDIEDEVNFLSHCGLKTQLDTLRLSRLMVRAKLVQTRLNLLAILRKGELPCRRLFMDYHGLRLLHGWMSEDGGNMNIRLALLETLETLPIVNKTVLTDSKVYQTVRNWCGSPAQLSPNDDSSKESSSSNSQTGPTGGVVLPAEVPSDLQKLASKLTSCWDNLPEIFRIPKRERIEQMKEHEREADRQYAAASVEDDSSKSYLNPDRYQRDRFGRGFTNRFSKPHKDARNISTLGTTSSNDPRRRSGLDSGSQSAGADSTKHLSKEQRREMFAAKVARDEAEKRLTEERREFDTKCRFFGLDPKKTRPQDVPFCVNPATGQWFSADRRPIPTPPSYAHVQVPVKPKSTDPADYQLPAATATLPTHWKFAITPQGKIYYYHIQHRIPQWEPPSAAQIYSSDGQDGVAHSDSESDVEADDSHDEDDEILMGMDQAQLKAYIDKKVEIRRLQRYNRLVDERAISPRREEDRIYNQIEARKYKENKEKIRKRKEEIRRKRAETYKMSTLNMCTLGSLEDSTASGDLQANRSITDNDCDDDMSDMLPIQDYLLSSDEEDTIKAECNNSPLIDKIVQGDKIVDELDALKTNRALKRPLPPHRDLSGQASTSGLSSAEKYEHKKRKLEKKEKSKKSKEADSKYRKLKEKFRCEIAAIIVPHLKPYRKDSCFMGRIQSDEDFNHLARKLTHFVMIKELKYCESVGQTLVVTESVKNKSREFIKKYMAKYGDVYVKPSNDPEFKDIPFTL